LHEASKNPVLVALVHALRGMLRDTIAGTYDRDLRTAPRIEEHTLVFARVKAGDPIGAHDAMATHLHHSVRRPVVEPVP
jgi:DNA-binding FadR family transcriptional regulator